MKKIVAQPTHYQVACSNCGTIFTYEDEDINHSNFKVSCPVCNATMYHYGDRNACYDLSKKTVLNEEIKK